MEDEKRPVIIDILGVIGILLAGIVLYALIGP